MTTFQVVDTSSSHLPACLLGIAGASSSLKPANGDFELTNNPKTLVVLSLYDQPFAHPFVDCEEQRLPLDASSHAHGPVSSSPWRDPMEMRIVNWVMTHDLESKCHDALMHLEGAQI